MGGGGGDLQVEYLINGYERTWWLEQKIIHINQTYDIDCHFVMMC